MSRRFSQLEGPSPDELAFAAPLFTPLFALTGLPFSLTAPFTWFEFALMSPLVAIVSVAFGYIGLLFICIPVMALLYWARRLDAVRLCFFTTLLGGGLWTAWSVFGTPQQPELPDVFSQLFVGSWCSLGVTAVFCALGKIPLRAQRKL